MALFEPIETPYQMVLKIILEEIPQGDKQAQAATRIAALIDEKKLFKYLTSETISQTIKDEFNGAALVRITDTPQSNTFVLESATVANVSTYVKRTERETKILQIKTMLEQATGGQIDLSDISEALINAL